MKKELIHYPAYSICHDCAQKLGGNMQNFGYGVWEGTCPCCGREIRINGKHYKKCGGLASASRDFNIGLVDKKVFDKLSKKL